MIGRYIIRFIARVVIIISLPLITGCNPHHTDIDASPMIEGSDAYSLTIEGVDAKARWWEALNDRLLDKIIFEALSENLTLKQARARIEQAIASDSIAASFLLPEVTGIASGEEGWTDGDRSDRTYIAGASLSWEIDFWKRLSSTRKAAVYEILASREELEAAALFLTSRIAGTYFEIIEQKLQLQLIDRQIEAGKTLLELIELRFGYGEASVVDVFQQRQQLASIRTRGPIVQSRLRTLENRLSVQLGRAPMTKTVSIADKFPELPSLPDTGVPLDLLQSRPDLKQIYNKLAAIDFRVAAALADRFPKIELSGDALYKDSLSTDGMLFSILLRAAAPIFDHKRRSSTVKLREAEFREELARYSEAYLTAIEEVENALWQEKYQHDLLQALENQISIARANLTETRNRYQQGLTDYLPVLTAIQSLQGLERDILAGQRQLVSVRILLYRSLGGSRLTNIDNRLTSSENIKTNIPERDAQ